MRALRVIAARQAALAEWGFTKAYVYALLHGVYPLLSEGDGRDPFDGGYRIDREFVEAVLEAVRYGQQPPSFYELERTFGQGKRMALVHILKYAYLSEEFDDALWRGILSDCPGEARSITRAWNLGEIMLEHDHAF